MPNTIACTADANHETTWVMVDQNEHGVRYARVTPAATAGTVAVTVLESQATRTRLQVRYDLTALSSESADWLERFAYDFDKYIAHWEAAIAGNPPEHQ